MSKQNWTKLFSPKINRSFKQFYIFAKYINHSLNDDMLLQIANTMMYDRKCTEKLYMVSLYSVLADCIICSNPKEAKEIIKSASHNKGFVTFNPEEIDEAKIKDYAFVNAVDKYGYINELYLPDWYRKWGKKGEYLKTRIKGKYYLTDLPVNRPRIRYVLPNNYISKQSIWTIVQEMKIQIMCQRWRWKDYEY